VLKSPNLPTIFIITLSDMLSYAIFAPMVVMFFLDTPYSLLSEENTNTKHILLGLFLSIYSSAQLMSNPFWGRLAPWIGRKKILSIAFIGNCIGYLTFALGVYSKNIYFLFAGVFVAGLLGANIAVIHSYIAEHSSQKNWARIYSFLGFIISLAFIIGPQISAYIISATPTTYTSFVIMFTCFFLSLNSLIIVNLFFPKEIPQQSKNEALENIKNTYKNFFNNTQQIRQIPLTAKRNLWFLFFICFGWISFIKFFQAHLLEEYQIKEAQCCQMTSLIGVSCALWQILRSAWPSQFFEKRLWFFCGSLVMAISLLYYSTSYSIEYLPFWVLLISFSYTTLLPSIISRILAQDFDHKDYISSLSQSFQALAKISAPLITGIMSTYMQIKPIWISFVAIVCALIISTTYFKEKQKIKDQKICW
jgi:MFS transporter, DHA1 family, tetracycline resistance protein